MKPKGMASRTGNSLRQTMMQHTMMATTAKATKKTEPPLPTPKAAPVFCTRVRLRMPGMRVETLPAETSMRTAAFVAWSTMTTMTATSQKTVYLRPRADAGPYPMLPHPFPDSDRERRASWR